ncbi:MAG: hypothetical protein COC24_010230 [Alphaproteobacteria bacterium]|nr:hypothetical protein [Alphaproteobacteria bacterium]
MQNEQLLQTDGSVKKTLNQAGTLFYCHSTCYGQFFEADAVADVRGRVMYHERPTKNCPAVLDINNLRLFDAYEGARQVNSKRQPR